MARSNSLEGGSDETTVTSGNSGGTSGSAFNNAVVGTGATVVYDNAQAAHGTYSCRTGTTGTSALAYVGYNLSSVTTDYCRAYYRLTSLPSAATQPILRYLSGANQSFRVNVKSGGAIEVRDAGNNVVGTTTAVVSAGSWFRVEVRTVQSATVGVVELRYYASPNSSSATETLNLTGLTLTANATEVRFGVGAALANAVSTWIDNIAVEGTAFFGPALVTGTAVRASTFGTVVAGGRTVVGTATRTSTFTADAAGTVEAGGTTVFGTATRTTTAGTAANGTRQVLGTAARAATFGTGPAGTRTTLGTAARSTSFGTAAAGTRTVTGSAARQTTATTAATGLRTVLGQVNRAVMATTAAAGTRAVFGVGTLTVTFGASAAGSVPASHEVDATLTASATAPTLATSTTAAALDGSATRSALGASTSTAVLVATA